MVRVGSWGASSNRGEVEMELLLWAVACRRVRSLASYSACWGFNTATLAFWSWLNLLCLFIIYLFDWTNHGQRGLWVKLVKFGCFQSAVEKKTDTARSERQMDRSSQVLTFRRLLLDVRSCQVPVDQRRLTAGKVTHNALGERGLIKLESGISETGVWFVWITHHF